MENLHSLQYVELDRGMAAVLIYYLQAEQRSLLRRDPHQGQRLSTTEALSLAPLAKLLKQLERLRERDKQPVKKPAPSRTGKPRKPKPARPHRLKVAYPEMTTVRFYYARLLALAACTPDSYLLLQTILGRFHQPSLTLEHFVALPSPTQLPGYQANMFA